ncbi:hypothetical protein ACLMJK_000007 [Lecanora helva]
MAVVCACIPSLRPLFDILSRRFLYRFSPHDSSGEDPSSKRLWNSRSGSANDHLHDLDNAEDLRPLGHGVLIRGGRVIPGQGEEAEVDMPKHGITVKTEVTLVTTHRLDYDDRLF